MYKNEKKLIEELYILFNLHYLANHTPDSAKQLAIELDLLMIGLVKNCSSKSHDKIKARLSRVIFDSGLLDLIKQNVKGYKLVLFVHSLSQKILDSGYNIPNYITERFKPFFDIEANHTDITNEEWEALKLEGENNAEFVLNKLKSLGYFEIKSI